MALTVMPMGVPAGESGAGSIELSDPVPIPVRNVERASVFRGAPEKERAFTAEIVCDGSLLDENFDNGELDPGWWLENADGNTAMVDGYDFSNWLWTKPGTGVDNYAYSGEYAMISYSWYEEEVFVQDNWLGTPSVTIPETGDYILSYYAMSLGGEGFLDDLQVLVGEYGVAYTGSEHQLALFTSVVDTYEVPDSYQQRIVDLSAFAGKTITVAFRHNDSDKYAVIVENVQIGRAVENVPETSVTLDATSLSVNVAYGAKLTATVLPENATYKEVTWTSSDPKIVAVNRDGGMIGMGVGTAKVTATTRNGLSASCTVTVSRGARMFVDGMRAFGLYDLDSGAEDTWYKADRFGSATYLSDSDIKLLVGEFHPAVGKVFGFAGEEDGDEFDFVSVDTKNGYEVSVINEGVSELPTCLAYDFDNDIMYGGYYYKDTSDVVHFEIAKVDLTTGLKAEVVADVYGMTFECSDGNGGTVTLQHMVPRYFSCMSGGRFVAADVTSDRIVSFTLPSGDTPMSVTVIGAESLRSQIGEVTPYYQKLWYDPLDSMLYWAGVFGTACAMTVTDLTSGITVRTGIAGVEGAVEGIEISALFVPYELLRNHLVTFVDGLTGEIISRELVETGSGAEAPTPPEHEGYVFTGWDKDFSSVYEDLTVTALYEPELLIGDVTCNGVVDFEDVSVLSAYTVGCTELTEQGIANGDVNGDGITNSVDISYLYNRLLNSSSN